VIEHVIMERIKKTWTSGLNNKAERWM